MIDTANLAMCVSETTDTLGFGQKNEEVVSINRKNMEEDYRDSIIFPFRDTCGQSCNSDGTEQGNTSWVVIILCLNFWQWMYCSSRELNSHWLLALMPIEGKPC